MAKNNPNNEQLSDADIALFRQSMQGVKPVCSDQADINKRKPTATPKQLQADEQAALDMLHTPDYDPSELDFGDEISYHQPGIQHSVLRKLRRGQYSLTAELDLHGFTAPEARRAVAEFLEMARQTNKTCVRIIHGKGRRSSNKGPVLKPLVAKWLTLRDDVLAYCTARPVDGGSGAVYVLLKR